MRALFGVLLLAAALAPARAAYLRAVQLNETMETGWLRILALYSGWTSMDDTLIVPAGYPVVFGNAIPTAVATNVTVPVELSLRLQSASPDLEPRMGEWRGHCVVLGKQLGDLSARDTLADGLSAVRQLPISPPRSPLRARLTCCAPPAPLPVHEQSST